MVLMRSGSGHDLKIGHNGWNRFAIPIGINVI
jgi:hypothetical protein